MMATPQELYTQSLTGLAKLASMDPQKYADDIYSRSVDEIERQSGDTARAINENTFGRGLGLSTITRDLQVERDRLRQENILKARRDADLAGNQASLAALGQAAAASQGDLSRQQQREQYEGNRQDSREALKRQEAVANRGMLTQGLGALGAAGLMTAGRSGAFKGMGGGLKSLYERMTAGGPGGPVPAGGAYNPMTADSSLNDPGGLQELSTSSFSPDAGASGDYSVPSFDYASDLGDFGGYGLESLLSDESFNFDPFSVDWTDLVDSNWDWSF